MRNQITTFGQREDESLDEAWERFKDLLRLCLHYGLQRWMLVEAFYNRVTEPMRSTADAVAESTLMNKTEDKAYNLIKEMGLNNYQWSNERSQPKRIGGKLELDDISMLSAKVHAISKRLEQMNVNPISSSTPSSSGEIYGSIDHLTMNCEVNSPIAIDVSEPINYVNNFILD